MFNKMPFTVVASSALIWAAAPAQAVPITFEFSGHVTSIIDNAHVLGSDVVVDDTFQGSYTYESTVQDSHPGDPNYGRYDSTSFVMHVAIGAFDLWSGSQNTIQVYSYSTYDSLSFGASGFNSAGLRVSGMVARITDDTGSALSSDALPVPVPPATAFTRASFGIEGFREQGDSVGFSISGVIVPEPGTISMLVLGAFAVKRRRVIV